MLTKNINSIFYSRFSLVFKIVLYVLIIVLFFSILGFSIIAPISKNLREDISKVQIGHKFASYVEATLTGSEYASEARTVLVNAISQVDDIMAEWNGSVIAAIVVYLIISIIFSVIYFMSYFPMSDIINNFMSSNSDYGFGANYIANLKKSFFFSLWYTLYTLLIYAIGFSAAIGLGLLIGRWSALAGLFVMYLLAISVLALRRALTPFWIPAMVSLDLNVKEAFYKNMEQIKGRFLKTFGIYFMLYIASIVVFLGATFLTFGVASIFVFCGVWVYFQIRDLVAFYYINGKKYYIDEQTVVNPKKLYRDAVLDEENFKL